MSCDSEDDCPAGECCVAPLKGKRDLSSLKAGICRPIPAEGGGKCGQRCSDFKCVLFNFLTMRVYRIVGHMYGPITETFC